jgi:hypothetical protein
MAAKLTRLTHKIAIQLHLVAEKLYHLQFSLQASSPETFRYTLVLLPYCDGNFTVIVICGSKVNFKVYQILLWLSSEGDEMGGACSMHG